jgi:hypothetical protein
VSHDDACTLRINGRSVYRIDGWRWTNENNFFPTEPVELNAGDCVDIEVTLVNYNGPTHLQVHWSSPQLGGRQPIPTANMSSLPR